MALEVLKHNYGQEIYVWSAGVILYIMLYGVPPFWAETEQGVAQAFIHSVIDFKRDPWPKVSDSAKDLVKKMLDPNPKRRLSYSNGGNQNVMTRGHAFVRFPIYNCLKIVFLSCFNFEDLKLDLVLQSCEMTGGSLLSRQKRRYTEVDQVEEKVVGSLKPLLLQSTQIHGKRLSAIGPNRLHDIHFSAKLQPHKRG